MKKLTPGETSVLALIAASRDLSGSEYKKLFAELSPDAQEVAAALFLLKHDGTAIPSANSKPSTAAEETARALLAWA